MSAPPDAPSEPIYETCCARLTIAVELEAIGYAPFQDEAGAHWFALWDGEGILGVCPFCGQKYPLPLKR